MAEQEATINTDQPVASSAPTTRTGDLVSTIPMPEVAAEQTPASGETIKTETPKDLDKEKAQDNGNPKPEDDKAKDKGDDARLDKHPRFKSLIDTNRVLREQNQELMGKVDLLIKRMDAGVAPGQQSTGKEGEPKGMLFAGKTNEELTDLFDENPQKFLTDFADNLKSQFKDEFMQMRTQETQEAAYRRSYEEFADKNPDFLEMWDSGEISAFLDKNPGHNAISAFYALSEPVRNESVQQQIAVAVKKAVEEEKTKIEKNLKAKRSITYVPAAPRETGDKRETTIDMKDSKKFGGTISVLARRLALKRQQG